MSPVRTPLYDVHTRLGARIVDFAGFEMPVQYAGILAEHQRVREQVGLFDVSHMGEVRVTGPEALDVVNRLITNDLHRIRDGRALYTCLCAEDGTIVDDMIVYRMSPEEIFICVNASNRATDFAHMQAHAEGDATLVDEGEAWSQIAVQGPAAPELLGRVFGPELAALKPFRLREAPFDGATVYYATTGYTGERGAEIYVPNDRAVALWEALEREGADLGVGPIGLGARDTLRLEMGYCLYGNDIDRTTTPLEAGLGWVTRLDKPAFVGREALVAQQEAGVPRKLVGLEVGGKGIPRHGYPVLHDGAVVGAVTSGTRSPSTGRDIALAYVPTALSEVGTELTVDVRGKAKPARVVTFPFLAR
ncbi:MAG: glycine cleavage system aminomethyltransferase GcvT [Deltaproteobacteria bacterium]|nr:MAG: glycine cleavage system aminomethyltransferase GcvT [Deltaproteobacteria bacterium]